MVDVTVIGTLVTGTTTGVGATYPSSQGPGREVFAEAS